MWLEQNEGQEMVEGKAMKVGKIQTTEGLVCQRVKGSHWEILNKRVGIPGYTEFWFS
jgi:hypothetical protein